MVIFYKNQEKKLRNQSYTAVSETNDRTAVEVITVEQNDPNLPTDVPKIHYISDSP